MHNPDGATGSSFCSQVAQESVFEKEALASGSMAEALKIMREKGFQQEKLSGRQKDVNPDLKHGEHWFVA